ncbi:hypothetical protein EDB81DRAFT_47400 [Dactylonectria macrodidyma]|uniref:F-box domain-containing protein n=1 Tax=Dactylonectria macrodidyma TaxID=307937 RepID=A0A9P9JJ91_9HYPO|nr:hypothetical protein EDB81DRAFT_47400 [Dactylonectria macrodidyma]
MRPSTNLLLPSPSYSSPPASPSLLPFSTPIPSRRMASSLKPTPVLNKTYEPLSWELLALIFEHLRDVDPPSLHSVRLASSRLDAIATPLAYRFLTLNQRIVEPDAEERYPNALRHISIHTHHVTISSNLHPAGITRILLSIQRLASIRWRYVAEAVHPTRIWLPSDVLDSTHERFSGTKLHVENVPLCEFGNHLRDCYIQAIPPQLLASLKLTSASPTLSTRLGPLKNLLIQSPQLRTLHYEDRGQGTSFEFQPGERLPPLVQLRLRSYDWNHSMVDVRSHWDFSQIEVLELVSVPVYNFLSSIWFDDLSGLRTLQVEDYSHLPDRKLEATGGLYLLIKNHIRALEVLDITCHTEIFPLDAIAKHQHTLRVLRFRDHVGFADDDEKCPTLWHGGVKHLSQHLTLVHTLELDMDVSTCSWPEFLHAVCAFPSLHTLTLHVQTLVRPLDETTGTADRDYEAALQMFRFLVQSRQNAHTSWKRITINVGGWKRVMVRRLGAAWHRQNEMGIYAERCFVFESDGLGRLVVREEMCLENSSRRASPAP